MQTSDFHPTQTVDRAREKLEQAEIGSDGFFDSGDSIFSHNDGTVLMRFSGKTGYIHHIARARV